jgi:hypothetical protein
MSFITRSYADGLDLTEAMLDSICDGVETKLETTKLNDDNLQNAGITGSTKLVDGSVTAVKLATDAVTTVKIQDDAVTKAKIAADLAGSGLAQNVDGSLEVTVDASTIEINADTLRVKDSGITTAKINAAAVTRAKLAAVGQQTSSGTSGQTVTSTSLTDLSNGSVSLTTTGRPVFIGLVSRTPATNAYIQNSGSTSPTCYVAFLRDGTVVYQQEMTVSATGASAVVTRLPISCFWTIDTPAAGTYTYKCQLKTETSEQIDISNVSLIAYEIA